MNRDCCAEMADEELPPHLVDFQYIKYYIQHYCHFGSYKIFTFLAERLICPSQHSQMSERQFKKTIAKSTNGGFWRIIGGFQLLNGGFDLFNGFRKWQKLGVIRAFF